MQRNALRVASHRFASVRERRLWVSTAAVVVAIYSTLGLVRTVSDELRERELFEAAFGLGVLFIALSVVALAVKARARSVEIGIGFGVAAVYLLLFARMGVDEERTHLIEYGVVALLSYEALLERQASGRPVRAPALVAVTGSSLVGVVDELVQLMIPTRVFDPIDIGFNAFASCLAVAARSALGQARRFRARDRAA